MFTRQLKLTFILIISSLAISRAQSWEGIYAKADSLMQARMFAASVPFYEQAITLCPINSKEYFQARNGLGRSLSYIETPEKAIVFLQENEAKIKQYIGEENVIYAQAAHNLGTFYLPSEKGKNSDKSLLFLAKAKDIRKKILGDNDANYANTLVNLGLYYRDTEQFYLGIPIVKEAIIVRKKVLGENHQDYIKAVTNLGVLYEAIGNYASAEEQYKYAISIYKKSGITNVNYTFPLNALAIIYSKSGDYAKAEQLYKEVIEIRKNLLGNENISYAYALNNLGLLYMNIGNYLESEKLYREVIAIAQKVIGVDKVEYAPFLNNLMLLQIISNKYDEALKTSKEIQHIYEKEKDLSKIMHTYLLVLNNTGMTYHRKGKYKESEKIFKKAIEKYEQIQNKNNNYYAFYLSSLAYLYQDMGKLNEAEQLFEKSLQMRKQLFSDKNMDLISNINALATLYRRKGEVKKSVKTRLKLNNIVLNKIAEEFPYLSEAQKESYYFNSYSSYISQFNSLSLDVGSNLTEDLYDLQLSTKALLMNSSQKMRNKILNSNDSILIDKYWKWAFEKEKISRTEIVHDTLQTKLEKIEKELSLQSEAFKSLTYKNKSTWKNIKQKLKKGEAAIEIVRVEKFGVSKVVYDSSDIENGTVFPEYKTYGLTDTINYIALIVKYNSSKPELVILKNGNELEQKYANYYKNSVTYQIEDTVSYRQYWQPIASKLKDINKVYFSPDGVYNQINLNVLKNTKTNTFLLEEIEIHSVTNTKDLLSFGNNMNEHNSCFVFGYPIYDTEKKYQTLEAIKNKYNYEKYLSQRALSDITENVELLPATALEANAIENILKSTSIRTVSFLEKNATEENVKSVRNAKILHISTHGFFVNSTTRKNAMLRSGLLFTGCSNYAKNEIKLEIEDGILTALEAANMELDGTDLVVLSACETGLGDVKYGEGVYGLQRAFRVAGAKTLIMSLWKVDDLVTQELMTSFYEKYANLKDFRKAFLSAQKQLKNKYPEPYYWGAFVMVGE